MPCSVRQQREGHPPGYILGYIQRLTAGPEERP